MLDTVVVVVVTFSLHLVIVAHNDSIHYKFINFTEFVEQFFNHFISKKNEDFFVNACPNSVILFSRFLL